MLELKKDTLIMDEGYINLGLDNIDQQSLDCLHSGSFFPLSEVKKKEWLKERFLEGHVYRKLVKGENKAIIEFAPLKNAFVPIDGDNYLYIYCLKAISKRKDAHLEETLLKYAIKYAKDHHMDGVTLLSTSMNNSWLTKKDLLLKHGFKVVDSVPSGYELLALSFSNNLPSIRKKAKREYNSTKGLHIYYSYQCPYILYSLKTLKDYCHKYSIPLKLHLINCLNEAKEMPSIFNNYAVFYNGKFKGLNILDILHLEKLLLEKN